MKKMFISMLAMAAMVSCSSENDVIDEVNPVDGKVEIKMNAGVISTKAPIESTGNLPTKVVALNVIQAPDAAAAVWTAVTGTAATPTLQTDGAIDFTTTNTLYYNADASKLSHLLAYSPNGTISTGSVAWTINGSNDIIVAKAVSGSKDSKISSLSFKHLLTQLQIEIKGDAAAATILGENITSIKIKDALNAPKMSFTSDEVTALDWSNSTKANFNVFQTGKDEAVANEAINTTGSFKAIGYAMLQPQDSYTLLISTDNVTEREVIVTMSETPVVGSAHKIQLTFSATGIEPTATISDWQTGTGTGSGTID